MYTSHQHSQKSRQSRSQKIRKTLQLAGLRFVISRARWLESEAKHLGVALSTGKMTMDEVDAKLAEMGALDLVYPELMGAA